MKRQILCIHGGEVFTRYEDYMRYLEEYQIDLEKMKRGDWKNRLQEMLGDDYEVILPVMPCKRNAKYTEWKIWFDKFVPLMREGVILIGYSLGGVFLAKYLNEREMPFRISATILVAAPFDTERTDYELGDFSLPGSLEKFEKRSDKILLVFSKDDPVVPYSDLEKYRTALPKAETFTFEDRGHFGDSHFEELISLIKQI